MHASVSDRVVVKGREQVGLQPARFRLIPGHCFVGAMSRASSPHQTSVFRANNRVKEAKSKGRLAEIVDLDVNSHGRTRARQRKDYRPAQQRVIKLDSDLNIGTLNVQGANWARTEERHISKFRCVIRAMQEHELDVACLSQQLD